MYISIVKLIGTLQMETKLLALPWLMWVSAGAGLEERVFSFANPYLLAHKINLVYLQT